jgi:hypothetical protein
MARPNLKTYSGNRITVEFDGVVVGLIQSLRLSDSYGLEDASGIGDIHVIEHVPSKAVHQVSVSNMTLFTGNMRDAGIANENGDMALRGNIFDIVIYGDSAPGSSDNLGAGGTPEAIQATTGTPVRTIIGCSFDSGEVDITAHRIVVQTGQFKALDVSGTGL